MCALHRALPVRHVRHAQMLCYAFAVTRRLTMLFYTPPLTRYLTGYLLYNQRVALRIARQKRGN